ncbi:MAG: photosystem II stability/assembly factor-like uncharacterized protein [Bacteroidia bacterium]|jgi:photosystem II stability/assembly factor-like uncharacterized protein
MRFLKYYTATILLLIMALPSFSQVDSIYLRNLEYRSLGPSRGGRSAAVCGVVGDRNLFYMGTTGGGVWKTVNGGSSWENISDGFFGGSVGSIAVAPSDDNVIYVGLGEETLRGNVSSGTGIWRSVDAGNTWTYLGLPESAHITRLAIDPQNPNRVFAAVLGNLFKDSEIRGLYLTEDGGKSWNKALYSTNKAGCNEVTFDPTNPRILFASFWEVRRTPYDFSSGGAGSSLHKSIDGGATWTVFTKENGLPEGILGKITVTASKAQKGLVFSMIEHKTKGGLYRSVDYGKNWVRVNHEAKIRQRAWYFSRIYADPVNPDVIYTTNVQFEKSEDGGKTFSSIRTPHVDHHDLWIDPNDNARMIVADDGGGQVSYTGGDAWSSYYNQPTGQFYRVTTDDHSPYRIYGAQQDNSTLRINHLTGRWENSAGGESAHIAIDPENNDVVYAGSYGGYLTRYNHETNENRGINVWPINPMGEGAIEQRYRFQWNFPVFYSPHNKYKIYAASNHLHVSYNEGESWDISSPDLTTDDTSKMHASGGPITKDNTGVEYYCTIFAAVESVHQEGVLYVGSDDGLINISKDGGVTWTNITPKKLPEFSQINCIEVDPHSKSTVYFAATRYKLGDKKPYLYKSDDYGAHWTQIVVGLPNNHFARAIRADLTRKDLLYAGTEAGMYLSVNGGQSWQSFQLNLPVVPITDLALKENDLIVATQGRGFYIIDDLSALQNVGNALFQKDLSFLSTSNAALTGGAKASFAVWLKNEVKDYDSIRIEVTDPFGDVAAAWSTVDQKDKGVKKLELNKGVNYLSWDLMYEDAFKPNDMILWWAGVRGPRAAPGTYLISLESGGDKQVDSFDLQMDMNSEATEYDYENQFLFLREVNEKVDETNRSVEEMRNLIQSIKQVSNQYNLKEESDETYKFGQELSSKLDSILNDLYQTQNESAQDPINYPIKLNNKLAHLNSLVGMGNYAPTTQAIAVKNQLVLEINDRLKTYQELKTGDLKAFNIMLRGLELDYISTH